MTSKIFWEKVLWLRCFECIPVGQKLQERSFFMRFNLRIFEGTDSIRFGTTSEEIQSILKIKPTLFNKSEFDLFETEDYSYGCHVYYEERNSKIVCAAFEFMEPSEVFLDNVQLIGEKRENIELLFKSKFGDCDIEPDGFNSPKHEIFVSLIMDLRVQSVYISRKGYSESQREFYKKAYSKKYNVSI